MTEQELDQYWDEFLRKTGRSPEDKCAGDLKFEAKGFVADELVSLVLGKKKRRLGEISETPLSHTLIVNAFF